MPRLLNAPLTLVWLSVIGLSVVAAGCADANAKNDDGNRAPQNGDAKNSANDNRANDNRANDNRANDDRANANSDEDKPWHVEEGEVSFYADSLAGNLTANGEKFDPKQATCAHRTLPFGTLLKITIGEGDQAVSATCRVNDRGPYAKGRVLDVSSSLAETLGFTKQGHAQATLTSVGQRPEKKSDQKPDNKKPDGKTPDDKTEKEADEAAAKKKGG